MSQVAYNIDQAAKAVGMTSGCIVNAINDKTLISRYVYGQCVIAHYDLEIWILGQPDYLSGLEARKAAAQDERDHEERNRLAKSAERREAKAQRAAMKAAQVADAEQLAADLAELDRLRELTRN